MKWPWSNYPLSPHCCRLRPRIRQGAVQSGQPWRIWIPSNTAAMLSVFPLLCLAKMSLMSRRILCDNRDVERHTTLKTVSIPISTSNTCGCVDALLGRCTSDPSEIQIPSYIRDHVVTTCAKRQYSENWYIFQQDLFCDIDQRPHVWPFGQRGGVLSVCPLSEYLSLQNMMSRVDVKTRGLMNIFGECFKLWITEMSVTTLLRIFYCLFLSSIKAKGAFVSFLFL